MDRLLLLSALGTGLGAMSLAWFMTGSRRESESFDETDKLRQSMRAESTIYRCFEPLVRFLARLDETWLPKQLLLLKGHLDTLAVDRWRTSEYLAVKQIEFLPTTLLFGLVVGLLQDPISGVAATVLFVLATPWIVLRNTGLRAAKRVRQIRARLPYTLDLMALILEAGGGTLHECLVAGAEENCGHPLGEELRRVVDGIERGLAPVQVQTDMSHRLKDVDIEQIILAINTSESQGLSLRETLRGIAERLRARQLQWLEKSAEEAKVNITWPAMVVMVGCLLIITAPIVLGVLSKSQ